MTVRVLSLFDDDDFLPEKPKNTPENTSDQDKSNDNNSEKTTQEDTTNNRVIPNFINIELPPIVEETNNEIDHKEEIVDTNLDNLYKEAIILSDYTQYVDFEDSINTAENASINIEIAENNTPEAEEHSDYIVTENFVFEESNTPLPTPNVDLQEKTNYLPEWSLDKKYYGISDVAKLFNANISHIRFWTNEFKLKIRTNKKGDRLYSPENIELLRKIHYLVKVKKHTIKGAQEILKNKSVNIEEELSLKDSLESLKEQLTIIRSNL